MSRTDETRPWWVQTVDAAGLTCKPVHDHRFGPCTLPDEPTAIRTFAGLRQRGCYWGGTDYFRCRRYESHGYREWNDFRRKERRRSRHQARRELRAYHGEY
jgi:hypothetical protein